MKFINQTILLFCVCFCVNIQAQNTHFKKTIWRGLYPSEGGVSVQCEDEGYLVVVSLPRKAVNRTYLNINFIKLNKFGDTIWSRNIVDTNKNEVIKRVIQTSDKGFIMTGYTKNPAIVGTDQLYIVKTDSLGLVQWNYEYGLSGSFVVGYGNDILQTKDKGYIAVGYQKSSSGFDLGSIQILKIDSIGNTTWTNFLSSVVEGKSIEYLPADSSYLISGFKYFNIATIDSASLTKIDKNGNELWTKYYSKARGRKVLSNGGTGFTLLTTKGLIKTNNSGNILFTKNFSINANYFEFVTMIKTYDNGFMIGGYKSDTFLTNLGGKSTYNSYIIIKLNQNLDSLWSQTFSLDGMDSRLLSLQQTIDSGYVICGNSQSFEGFAWLIKTDKNGMVPGCYPFIINPKSEVAICNYNSYSFGVPIGLNKPYKFQWLKNNILIIDSTRFMINAKDSGIYKMIITDSISSCKDTSNSLTLKINTLNGLNAGKDEYYCYQNYLTSGSTTILNGLPKGGSWTGDDITSQNDVSVTIKNLTIGKHVYVYNIQSNNCQFRDTMNIFIDSIKPPIPLITANNSLAFCQGDSVILEANFLSNDTLFLWNPPSYFIKKQVIVKNSGVYYCRAYSKYNCLSDTSNKINVTVKPNPEKPYISYLGQTNFCDGDSMELKAESPYSKYLWSNNDTTKTINVKSEGYYNVRVISNDCFSSFSDDVEVIVNSVPKTPTILQIGNDSLEVDILDNYYEWYKGVTLININAKRIQTVGDGIYKARLRNNFNCFSEFSTIYNYKKSTGMENINNQNIVLFPNPASNKLFVNLPDDLNDIVEISVYETTGKCLVNEKKPKKDNQIEIDLTTIINGVYLIEIKTENSVYRKAFTKY